MGISVEDLQQQLEIFQSGFKPTILRQACVPGNGITTLSDDEVRQFIHTFETRAKDLSVLKFVPASGAASRMFKHLHQYDPTSPDELCLEFLHRFDDLPFAEAVRQLATDSSSEDLIRLTLDPQGLGYATVPKGMVLFHKYASDARTAFEEHLSEGIMYASSAKGVNIHFTVPDGQVEQISEFLGQKAREDHPGVDFNLSYSVQKPFTDTIAATMDNQPFRDEAGRLVFRPGGHGALIHNLDAQPSHITFIKNIDNVVHESRVGESLKWKKVLGGMLIEVQTAIHSFLKENNRGVGDPDALNNIRQMLGVGNDMSDQELTSSLNAPIRVCAMVKNEGEPGGGPFWVEGAKYPQVVESAQISASSDQQAVVAGASHFNPTDLVCCTLNYQGKPFNLLDFVDPDTCFISQKSIAGTTVQALELPGLWNGAMARWVSVFVEIPVSTFNPVKTVNDLLRPVHQPQ